MYGLFATKCSTEADDLTQQTFSEFRAAAAGSSSPVRSVRALLLRIARNKFYDLVQRRTVREKAFDPEAYSLVQMVPDLTPSQVLAARSEERLLLQSLRRIPLQAQLTIEMYYWESMPVADIAEVLEVAPGTVMSRLARARDRLRRAMEDLTEDQTLLETTMTGLETWSQRVRDQAGTQG